MMDAAGQTRATISVNKDGAMLTIWDKKGGQQAVLTEIAKPPGGALILWDETGKPRQLTAPRPR